MTAYAPVSCEFHDLLESLAISGSIARIVFADAEGDVQVRSASIADLYAREGIEYLVTSTGETVRLDWLVEVNGERLSNSTG